MHVQEAVTTTIAIPPSYPRPDGEQGTTLHSAEHDKFWQINQSGAELHIRFGKTGTRGQVQIKSYSSEEEAASHKDMLVNSQLESGYRMDA